MLLFQSTHGWVSLQHTQAASTRHLGTPKQQHYATARATTWDSQTDAVRPRYTLGHTGAPRTYPPKSEAVSQVVPRHVHSHNLGPTCARANRCTLSSHNCTHIIPAVGVHPLLQVPLDRGQVAVPCRFSQRILRAAAARRASQSTRWRLNMRSTVMAPALTRRPAGAPMIAVPKYWRMGRGARNMQEIPHSNNGAEPTRILLQPGRRAACLAA
jgi:hypothetical protein